MSLATQLLRIMLFSFSSFLAANVIGVWDAEVDTLTLQVDSVSALLGGVGGHLAKLGWWRRASRTAWGLKTSDFCPVDGRNTMRDFRASHAPCPDDAY